MFAQNRKVIIWFALNLVLIAYLTVSGFTLSPAKAKRLPKDKRPAFAPISHVIGHQG